MASISNWLSNQQEDDTSATSGSGNRSPLQACVLHRMNVPPPVPSSSSKDEANKDSSTSAPTAPAPSNVAAPADASSNNLVIEVVERPKRPLSGKCSKWKQKAKSPPKSQLFGIRDSPFLPIIRVPCDFTFFWLTNYCCVLPLFLLYYFNHSQRTTFSSNARDNDTWRKTQIKEKAAR